MPADPKPYSENPTPLRLTTAPDLPTRVDVVVVGARAAGSATAAFLAQGGARVLVVDPRSRGADTLSTHALMRTGVRQLARLSLVEAVRQSNAPTISKTTFYYGRDRHEIALRPTAEAEGLYAPRRFVLDELLTNRAAELGAVVALGHRVVRLSWNRGRVVGVVLRDPSGKLHEVEAAWVVGADGASSQVAEWVHAETWMEGSHRPATLYAHVPLRDTSYHWVFQHAGESGAPWAAGIIPTNNHEACVFVGSEREVFVRDFRADPNRALSRMLPLLAESVAEQLASQLRQPLCVQYFYGRLGKIRRPWGPGWALVGDAVCTKDPSTAHGISNALRDAQLLAREIHSQGNFEVYERALVELSMPLFQVTERIAALTWTFDELQSLHKELATLMKRELSFLEHVESPTELDLRSTGS